MYHIQFRSDFLQWFKNKEGDVKLCRLSGCGCEVSSWNMRCRSQTRDREGLVVVAVVVVVVVVGGGGGC